jgi:alkanesulfonate monooxygenase SsuD/methylene tetrahydromethanopterin reductase-like flavin-dependent oxidoreductase (luciferase family)
MDRKAFVRAIREVDEAGATGVSVSDHLYATTSENARRRHADPACDPLTTLALVAGLSARLELQTVVVNTAWLHPALVVRQFAQLAQFSEGAGVTAGLGGGWSRDEFEAIGMSMPKFSARMNRLEEVLKFAREMFHQGYSTLDGDFVTAADLPMSPRPAVPPQLLVGGGSDRVMAMAGRYADLLDLHGHPSRGTVAGPTTAIARHGDALRRALTTHEDLEERMTLVNASARSAGRATGSVSVSGSIFFTAYGDPANTRAAEEELCARWAEMPYQSLAASPYLLFGTPAQMAESLRERRARYGLDRVTLLSEPGMTLAPPDPLRFCREVLPLI